MGPAATEVVGERVLDLRLGRFLVGGDKRRRLHDHAVDAVATLCRLLLDEGALHRMRLLGCAEPFESHDLLLCRDLRQRRDAGTHRLAVDMYRAGAALTEPAAKARAMQRQVVAERVKERHVGIIDRDRDRLAIDVERFALSHVCSPGAKPFSTTLFCCYSLPASREARHLPQRRGADATA